METPQGNVVSILHMGLQLVRICTVVLLGLVLLFLDNVTVTSGDYSFLHTRVPLLSVLCLILALGFRSKWRRIDRVLGIASALVCILVTLDIAHRV